MQRYWHHLLIITLLSGLLAFFLPDPAASTLFAQTASDAKLSLTVRVVTGDGEEAIVPLQINQNVFAAMMSRGSTAAVMQVMRQLNGEQVISVDLSSTTAITSETDTRDSFRTENEGELLVDPPNLSAQSSAAAEQEFDIASILGVNEETTEEDSASTDADVDDADDATGDEEADAEEANTEDADAAVTDAPDTDAPDTDTPATNANAYQRTAPTTDAAILGQLPEGTEVNIIGRNSNGEWLYVEEGGWVASFLIENVPESLSVVVEPSEPPADLASATVSADTVILRDGPGQQYASLDIYDAGTVTAALGLSEDGEWLEIVTPEGRTGWMAAVLVDVDGTIASVTDASTEEVTVPENSSSLENDPTTLRGRVVDGEGEGINNVVVAATQVNDGLVQRMEATSADDGSFEMNAPRGSTSNWALFVADVGCDSRLMNDRCQMFGYYAAVPQTEVTLPQSETAELVYNEATSIIAGTVLRANGQPVGRGNDVRAERADGATTAGETSSSGKFVLPAGVGTWYVVAETGPATEVEVVDGSAPDPIEVTTD